MTLRKYGNNISTTLDGAIDNSQTTITLLSAAGIPAIGAGEFLRFTVDDGTNIEMMDGTDDAATPDYTVTRGVEGTSGTAFASGTPVEIRVTVESFTEKQSRIAETSDVIDFGAATSLEIPNSAAPTVNADGEIALDTTITDHKGLLKYYSGEVMVIPALPIANLISTDTYVISYDAASDSFTMTAQAGGGYAPGGTDVAVTDGGTGRSTGGTAYAIITAGTTATGVQQTLAIGSVGQILQSAGAGALATWSTPTYPSNSGTVGCFLRSDGTNYLASTVTWFTDTCARGDLVTGRTSNNLKFLALGSANCFLTNDGTDTVWSTSSIPTSAGTSGKILVSNGTNYVLSTPTFPNASATTRKMTVSDGTNWVASTETWAVPGTTGNLLTSDGTNWTSAVPASFTVINIQVFTADGTYTPTAGMKYCIIEAVGGGGGGGGCANSGAGVVVYGSAGGAGSYARKFASAATIGASKAITIGTSGAAGANTGGTGGNGGDTSLTTICIGKGGTGGIGIGAGGHGGAGGVLGTGDVTVVGNGGMAGGAGLTTSGANATNGGTASYFGGAGKGLSSYGLTTAGQDGTKGAGGGGGMSVNAGGAVIGGAGGVGYVVITEFI